MSSAAASAPDSTGVPRLYTLSREQMLRALQAASERDVLTLELSHSRAQLQECENLVGVQDSVVAHYPVLLRETRSLRDSNRGLKAHNDALKQTNTLQWALVFITTLVAVSVAAIH